jgi:hypothetical protein
MDYRLSFMLLTTLISVPISSGSGAQNQRSPVDAVIIKPAEIPDLLTNPGMGITTFQRFNGDPPNTGVKWSEEGPTEMLSPAAARPDFPDASIAYCRWFWRTIEPEHGHVRWEIMDTALEQARLHHQTLAIRLMPYDQRHPLPEWYQSSGARRANRPSDKDGSIWQPDFSDPLYLKHWGEIVAQAGVRYDGNPYLDSVDISSVGYWGEGWSDYMPAFSYQQPLIDIWLRAFKQTPLLMNFDEQEALSYGTAHGAGWRLDCWGDMRSNPVNGNARWCHMLDFYPQQIVRAGIQDVWKRSPVSLETCWVPLYWLERGWDIDYILEQALRWHASSVNIKSSIIPPPWRQKFDEFQKRMGYRLVLRRLEYPRTAERGHMLPVHMWWSNLGVAPVYRDYLLAMQLYSAGSNVAVHLPAALREWLPGDAVFDGAIYIPSTLSSGSYRIRVALLDPRTEQPAIKLAIAGRQADGWYDLGAVSIE